MNQYFRLNCVLGLWGNKLWTDWTDDKGHSIHGGWLLHWSWKWFVLLSTI